jgi:hypothetical protein
MINAPFCNTTLQLFSNYTSVGDINITRSRINMTSEEQVIPNPGIYVLVNASNSIKNNLSYVVIRVNYTDVEVSPFVESSLRLHKWNTASSTWDAGNLNEAGIDILNNSLWVNVTTFGEFVVTGDIYVPSTLSPAPGSSGGGGGGGR